MSADNSSVVSIALTLGALLDRSNELYREESVAWYAFGAIEDILLIEQPRGARRRAVSREMFRRLDAVSKLRDSREEERRELEGNIAAIFGALRDLPERAAVLRLAGVLPADWTG